MAIPKFDFWKLMKVSFFSDFLKGGDQGVRMGLEQLDEVLTAVESLDLPRPQDSVEPEEAAAWKEWSDSYQTLYDRLKDIETEVNMLEDYSRKNNENYALWDKQRERCLRLREKYGKGEYWDLIVNRRPINTKQQT